MKAVMEVPLTLKMRMGTDDKKPIAHRLIPQMGKWGLSAVTVWRALRVGSRPSAHRLTFEYGGGGGGGDVDTWKKQEAALHQACRLAVYWRVCQGCTDSRDRQRRHLLVGRGTRCQSQQRR